MIFTIQKQNSYGLDRPVGYRRALLRRCTFPVPVFYRLSVSVILVLFWTLTAHVSHIVSVCYFHLRQLRLIRRSLTADTAHIMVRALIHICLDYCNSLLFGLPAGQIA